MQPAPPALPDEPSRLRQQLIIAQARLLELEDTRQALVTRLALLDRTLDELQVLANGKMAERDHQVLRTGELERQAAELIAQREQLAARERELETKLAEATARAHQNQCRIVELDTKLATVISSRSWRWTQAFRSLGRLFTRSS